MPREVGAILFACCLFSASALAQMDPGASVSRVPPNSSASSRFSPVKVSPSTMQKMTQSVRTPGSPPSPILGTPADGFSVAAPVLLTFAWRDGDGAPRARSFRFCIAEVGTQCGDPDSFVVPSVTEPNPITGTTKELRFDPASPGGFGAWQGKRLVWTVAACAPNQQLPAASGVSPESCTYAPLRTLDYPLPAPVLKSPPSGTRLPDRYPLLRWEYVKGLTGALHLSGVEHWLVCITRRGMACPTASVANADVYVTRVPVERLVSGGPISFPLTKEQRYRPTAANPLPLTGQGPFVWTVAACNTAYGCRYQPSVRQFEIASAP